jgi:hypothetical protein
MIDTPSEEDEAFVNYLEYYYPSYVSLTDAEYKIQVLDEDTGSSCQNVGESNNLAHQLDELEYESTSAATATCQVNLGGIKGVRANEEQINKESSSEPVEFEDGDEDTNKQSDNKQSDNKQSNNKQSDNKQSDEENSDSDPSDEEHYENPKKNKKSGSKSVRKLTRKNKLKTKSDHKSVDKSVYKSVDTDSSEKPSVLDDSKAENKTTRNAIEYNQLADIDISITTKDHTVFKERALQLYNVIYENCKHRGPVHIKEIRTIASVKYKIYGPGISRPMDIFRIPYDPVKMVKKFHVHAVKMFYDGDVTLFRSCVSSLLSGVGENYKWFSCNKVPADVLLKYAQRGITIILNGNERAAVSNYISDNDRWGNVLKVLNLGLYAAPLVIPQPKYAYPYGEVQTHDKKKIYQPDPRLINAVFDHIDASTVIDEDQQEF